jgi:hypothetical protein
VGSTIVPSCKINNNNNNNNNKGKRKKMAASFVLLSMEQQFDLFGVL